MRILFLSNHELTLLCFRTELLQKLIDAGHEVILAQPRGEFYSTFERMGCQQINIDMEQYGMNPIEEYSIIRTYETLLRRLRPDVLLCYTIKPNLYGGIAAAKLGIPYIATITGLGRAFERGKLFAALMKGLYRVALRRVNCLFLQNETQRALFSRMGVEDQRMRVVAGSGVNLKKHTREPYPAEEETRLLYAGWITRDKGVEELLTAFDRVKSAYPNLRLELLGGVRADCEALIDAHRNDPQLILDGWQEEVHPYMARCHALVHPSHHEGMANVLLEAAACGRPVLASKIPGCMETFDEGSSGFGFAAGDAEDLERTIRRFLALTREERVGMGLAGRAKMEREFDRETVVSAYMEELEKAIGKA